MQSVINSRLEAKKAHMQHCLYASKVECKYSPEKQDLSKQIGGKQRKWEKNINYTQIITFT